MIYLLLRNGKWKMHIKTYHSSVNDYFDKKLPLLFNLEEDLSEKYDLSSFNPD